LEYYTRAAAEEEEVSLGVIMTHRNLPYFPYHFTIHHTFLPHFPYLFSIQLAFLPSSILLLLSPSMHVYTLFFRIEKKHTGIVCC
jgi:hypothetical protein